MTRNEGPRPAPRRESPARRPSEPRPPPERTPAVVVVGGRIAPADVPDLCERLLAALECSDVDPVVCDVGALVEPDAVTIDALARLQLTARRHGRRFQLRAACGELRGLVALTGLAEVLPCGEPSALEPRGQAEQREQAGGVQEERDPGDPAR